MYEAPALAKLNVCHGTAANCLLPSKRFKFTRTGLLFEFGQEMLFLFSVSGLRVFKLQVEVLYLGVMTGPGGMTQQARTLPALPEDLGSIPSIHMVAHKHILRDLASSFAHHWSCMNMVHRHMYRQNRM